MKRNFLLMLLLTLLPLVGWAANPTITWKSSGSNSKVWNGVSNPDFISELNVRSGSGGTPCTSLGLGTSSPSGNVNQYRYNFYASTSSTTPLTGVLDAGSYDLRLFVKHHAQNYGTQYQDYVAHVSVTITQASNKIDAITMADYASDGIPTAPTCTADFGASTAEFKFATSKDGPWTWTWPSYPTAAGIYYVQASIPADPSGNYEGVPGTVFAGQTFKVAKKATLTTVPTLKGGLVYNDGPQDLIEGEAKFPVDYETTKGGVKYKVTDSDTKPTTDEGATTAFPQMTAAGKYYVWYKPLADGDIYIDGEWTQIGSTGVKISKRNITAADFTVTPNDLKWTGSAQELVTFAWNNNKDRGTETITPPTETAVNETGYDVYVAIAGDENHNDFASTKVATVIINKADNAFTAAPTATNADLTYDDNPKDLFAAGTATSGTAKYKVDWTSTDGQTTVEGTWVDAPIQGTNAGTYTLSYKAEANGNYVAVDEVTLGTKVTIKQAPVAISADPTLNIGWTYDNKAHSLITAPEPTVTGGTIKYIAKGANETEATEFSTYSDPEGARVNADTYTVSYELIADNTGNYKNVAAKPLGTVTVAKKEVILGGKTLPGTIETFYDKTDGKVDGTKPLYTASDFLEDIEILPGDDPKVILPKIVTMTYPAFENLIVGTNGVEFTANDDNNENYKAKVVGGAANLKIEAMPATVTTDPTGVTTVYNTEEQSLIATAGVANGGTVVYSLDKDAAPETWTEDIKRTNADDYTVYYSVKPDKFYTYTAAAVDFEAKITPAAVTPATIAAASDLVFEKGLAQPLVKVTGETLNGTMKFAWKESSSASFSEYSDQIPAQVNAGTYDVVYYVEADKNYESTAAITITGIEIAPMDLKDLAEADKFTLNPAEAVFTGSNLKPEVVTTLTDEDYDVDAVDDMTDVNKYTFTFTGKGNYKGIATATFEITANKAEISNLAIEGWTYGSYDPVKNAPKANTTFGEVTFSYTDENEEALSGVPVDAGTYFVVANVAASANWAAADPVKFQFNIKQKPVTPTAPKAHALTYNGLDQALVDAGFAEGATIQYATGEVEPAITAYSDAIPEEKNAATYKVWYKFTVDPNYTFGNALEAGSVDVKLNPASITYSLGNQTVTYNGSAATPKENEAYQITNGALMVGDGDAFTFEFTEINATDANEDGVPFTKLKTKWTKENEQNYAIQFNLTGKLFIQKAEVEVTAPEPKSDLAFNDANQQLMKAAAYAEFNGEAFDFIYSGNGISSSDFTEIVAKEAGEYEISWKVTDPGKNFKFVDADKKDAAEGTIKATIGAKTEWAAAVPAFADGDIEKIYNGTNFANGFNPVDFVLYDDETPLTVSDYTIEVNEKAISGKIINTELNAWNIKEAEITNAAEYKITYKGIGNYEGAKAEYKVVVDPKKIGNDLLQTVEDIEIANVPQATDLVYDKKTDYYKEPVVTYKVSEESTLTLVKAADKKDNDYTLVLTRDVKQGDEIVPEEVTEIRNAGDYTYTFEGKGNYSGKVTIPVNIAKAELIVIAPNATKTYDGSTDVEHKEFGELTYSGLLKGDHVELGELEVEDVVAVPEEAINVGEYTLTIDVTEFPEQENYEISKTNTLPGTLTINPAAPVKISFNKDAKFGKQYSQEDDLSFTATDLVVNEGDGVLFDDKEDVAELLYLKREAGEDVGDYTLSIDYRTSPEATAKAVEIFKKNYEKIEFGTGTFRIDPLKAALKVSIAATSSTYNGKAPQLAWAEDLSNMVVTGLPEGKKKDGIFTTLPTITIQDDEENVLTDATANAGEYNIVLSGGVSKNYTVVSLVGSYYTIEPVAVEAAFNTIPVAAVDVPAKDIMDQVTFTVKAVNEEDEATLAANMDKFEAQWTDLAAITNKDGNITATSTVYDALVIAYTGDEAEPNFIFKKEEDRYGDLHIGNEGGEIALNDASDVVTYASTKTTVTFSNSRAIKADKWQACVLPCTISIQEFSKAFGYAAIDVLDEERTQGDEIHFSLKVTGNIEAGVPFLFKANGGTKEDPKVDFIKVTLNDVDVASTAALVDEGVNVVTDPDNNVKFIGTFETVNITKSGYRYISNGKWYNTKDGYANPYVIRPLRAYLDLTEMTGAAGARIFIEEPDGTETAIDAIEFANEINGESIYTVDGKKVSKAAQKGIYIQNGKKIAVK
ncbi:MAG: hypothetical protein IKQ51_01885 [Bacteroidaceae bacterium]|nr:hypothetical protein [Bacteroidaceae bacterium]